MKMKLIKFLPWVLLLTIVLVVFRKFFFQGDIPMPADILAGAYYPWLDSKWGFPVKVPVKNSLPADIISIIYPWRVLGMQMLKSGHLPLWDHTILLGVPLLANFQAALLNPINILFLFLSNPLAWGIQIILQPILMAVSTYLFLRELKVEKFAAMVGGILFAFSGFALVWLPYNSINYTLFYFPLVLLLVEKISKKPRFSYSFILSIILALQIFSGYPLSVFYTLLFSGLYFVYRIFQRRDDLVKKILILGIGIALGLGVSAVQLLPGFELSNLSIRNLDKSALAGDVKYLPFSHLVTFFAPDFYGNPGTANYWSLGSYDNFAFFIPTVGIFFLLLAVVTKIIFKKDNLIFILFILLSLIYATQNPISQAIPFDFFSLGSSVNTRALFVFCFSVSVLSALGLDYVLRERAKFWQIAVPLMAYVFIIAGVSLGFLITRKIYTELSLSVADNHYLKWLTEANLKDFERDLANFRIAFRNLAIPSTIILITAIAAVFKNKKILMIVVSLLLIYSIKVPWDKYTTFVRPSLVFPTMPALEKLIEVTPNSRFEREKAEILPANAWSVYNLSSASGQDALMPLSTARYINLINTQSLKDELLTRYVHIERVSSPLFRTLNVSHYAALNRDVKESVPRSGGRPFPWIIPENFSEIANIDTVRIYENKDNLGPAWFSQNVVCINNFSEAGNLLIKKDYDPKTTMYVDCQENLSDREVGTAELITINPDWMHFKVQTPSVNYLHLSYAHYPGWIAYIDGKETEIKTSNVALSAVLVPGGEHNIELFYKPKSVTWGAAVSGGSLLIVVLGIAVSKKKDV